jgi:hypothetical protein
MSGNLAGHYALGANIDANPPAGWGAGFDPVGQIATNFTGNFDGLGHTITGLTIARPTDNVGLFGYVVSTGGAMLKNVTLAGGSVTGGAYVGNLVGHITGDIFNSHATQAVTGNNATDTYAGGLAGWSTGNISYSSSTGAVTGNGNYVGGLVGWITGDITCCFATGPVTGIGGFVGGLAGWVTGDISRSYATGNVNANALNVGGLVGWITGDVSNSFALGSVSSAGINVGGLVGWKLGDISNSFSAGAVSGAVPVGGLVGADTGGTISNSFWDLTTSGQGLSGGVGAGGAGAKGMPTPEMMQQVNFTSATPANAPLSPSWDFTNIWIMTSGVMYPTLQSCLVPAAWTAVPAFGLPPVLVPAVAVVALAALDLSNMSTSPDVNDTGLSAPLIQNSVGVPGGLSGLNLTVADGGVRMPPLQLVEAEPLKLAPPVQRAPAQVVPAPAPAVVPVVTPPARLVPLQRPRKQDRN